jgi:hypothetical protein
LQWQLIFPDNAFRNKTDVFTPFTQRRDPDLNRVQGSQQILENLPCRTSSSSSGVMSL